MLSVASMSLLPKYLFMYVLFDQAHGRWSCLGKHPAQYHIPSDMEPNDNKLVLEQVQLNERVLHIGNASGRAMTV